MERRGGFERACQLLRVRRLSPSERKCWMVRRAQSAALRASICGGAVALACAAFLAVLVTHLERRDWSWFLGLALVGSGAVASMVFAARRAAWVASPEKHPVVRTAMESSGVAAVSADIEEQLLRPAARTMPWVVTEDYLVLDTALSFDVLWIDALLWMYLSETTIHSNYGTIRSTVTTVTLRFADRTIELWRGAQSPGRAVTHCTQRAPWALIGYSSELDSMLSFEPDRFVEMIGERRRRVLRGEPPDA